MTAKEDWTGGCKCQYGRYGMIDHRMYMSFDHCTSK
jgi:hypothetical protein